jgi:hypothetical protein
VDVPLFLPLGIRTPISSTFRSWDMQQWPPRVLGFWHLNGIYIIGFPGSKASKLDLSHAASFLISPACRHPGGDFSAPCDHASQLP